MNNAANNDPVTSTKCPVCLDGINRAERREKPVRKQPKGFRPGRVPSALKAIVQS